MGAGVDGEITIPQSFPLYKQRKIQLPLHKGALGAEEDGGAVEKREAFLYPLSQKSKIFASSPIGRAKRGAAA